jgi:hypothetical protein
MAEVALKARRLSQERTPSNVKINNDGAIKVNPEQAQKHQIHLKKWNALG